MGTIDVSGHDFAATKKFRNVRENPKAAFVVDDVLPPWQPRSVMVRGRAQSLEVPTNDGDGSVKATIRITPEDIVSWGL